MISFRKTDISLVGFAAWRERKITWGRRARAQQVIALTTRTLWDNPFRGKCRWRIPNGNCYSITDHGSDLIIGSPEPTDFSQWTDDTKSAWHMVLGRGNR